MSHRSDSKTLFTIGHSNRDLGEFLDVLTGYGIKELIDVRSLPRSRRYPHFNREVLKQVAPDAGISYTWLGRELGGMRKVCPDSCHDALPAGFRGYADHMGSTLFAAGVERLLEKVAETRIVIMCAERDPAQCHRSLIADYLLLRQQRVIHLLELNNSVDHQINPQVRMMGRQPVYSLSGQQQMTLFF